MALNDPAEDVITYRRLPSRVPPQELVRTHMPLVRKIAWHVSGRVSSAIEVEDLMQIGMVALVEAANGYEDRGHAFATYATLRIRGAMIDHLRRHANMCRSAMIKRREIGRVREALEKRDGREPGEAQMAEAMNMSAADYRVLVDETQSFHHDSIDEVYSDQSMWFADVEDSAEAALERSALKHAIAAGIRTLPEREAMVLQLYFVEELNLEEIGLTLGIGAARVCQIKKAALDKLRGSLADWA